MAKLKFTVHPLFFLFGIYYAITGRVFVFLTYTIVAVMHEMGHAAAALKLGYRLNRVVLMPYGAVVSGNLKDLKFKDEIYVALAGPLTNLLCAVLFVALWWVAPVTYAYTDLAVFASLSIAMVNMLPCMPLDGGRVLGAFLKIYLKGRTVDVILKITGGVITCVLGGLFVLSCFFTVNISLLFFTLFALFGTFVTGEDKRYVKIFEGVYFKQLKNGAEVKKVAISSEATVKKLLSLLDYSSLTEVAVYSPLGEEIGIISPKKVCEVASQNLYARVGDLI